MSELVLERLLANGRRSSFVDLVHTVESFLSGRARVGHLGPFEQEPIRFQHDPALIFHTTDVVHARLVRAGEGRSYVEVTTTFLGLAGSASPMPHYFVEQILGAEDQAAVQREFLDIFHHRLLGLLYRALVKFDAPRSFEEDGRDRISRCVMMLCGLPPDNPERVAGLSRATLLRLAPLMATYPQGPERLAVAIRDVLSDVLGGAEVEVVPFVGGTVLLEVSERPRLGIHHCLGMNSLIGSRARAPASTVCVRIGPLTPRGCALLSPGGDRHSELSALASLFTPAGIAVRFELSPTHGAQAQLGRDHESRLGLNTWLGKRGKPARVRFRAPRLH